MTRAMKDSGIEWIGMIPEKWQLRPLYYFFEERKNKNLYGHERNLLSLSYGKIIRKNIKITEGLLPESFNTYNIIEDGDIIFRLTDLQNDKRSLRTGLAKEHGIITSAYITIKTIKAISNSYFHYLLHSYDVTKVFYNMGNGVRQGLNFDELKKLILLFPPLPEQQAIADYLDDKCVEIDNLSAAITEQIEVLKQYKKSVITEAVTKGLDPNVPMKDSGVEWIGRIPENWEVIKLKYIANIINGNTPSKNTNNSYYSDNGLLWLKPEDLKYITYTINSNEKLSFEGEQVTRTVPANTPLVCCIGATLGKVGISNQKVAFNQQINAILFFDNKIFYKYGLYFLFTQEEQHAFYSNGNVLKILNMENHKRIKIALPSLGEQQAIVNYLDNKCAQIDSVIKDKETQLETLAAYQKSLIYEYVTGKKEVPQLKEV